MKREAEQPLLTAGSHARPDVEKQRRPAAADRHHANRAGLLDDEQAVCAVTCAGDEYGIDEPGRDGDELDLPEGAGGLEQSGEQREGKRQARAHGL